MRLTRELCEAVVAGYLLGAGEKPALNGHQNGFVERAKHQRRRGRPPKGGLLGIGDAGKRAAIKKRKYTKRSPFWKKGKVEAA